MPLYTNTYPVLNTFTSTYEQFATGEDYYVTGLQQAMYNNLPARLGIASNGSTWQCFGRTFRNALMVNDRVDGYAPFAYNADKYLAGNGLSNQAGIYPSQGYVVSFFGEGGARRKESGFDVVPYELIFFIDTSVVTPPFAITPLIRIDEYLIDVVKNFVNLNGNGLHLRGTERDMDKVLEKYSGVTKRMNLIKNLQPFVCFKLNIELIYNSYLQPVRLVA